MVQEPQKIVEAISISFAEIIKNWQIPKITMPALPVQTNPQDRRKTVDFFELGRWLKIIKHPCVIIILGNRGSGKSAQGSI